MTKLGGFMMLVAWLIFFATAVFLFSSKKTAPVISNNKIIISYSNNHYRIAGEINGHEVNFLLDTGASLVAIPRNIAKKLKLTGRYPITINTANGKSQGMLTRVAKLSFGKFILHNIGVVILAQDADEVLMGMNVLKLFNITQRDKKLIITPIRDK